jgi:precorrin-2 dehydrogenase/sirohydrochlorin ferrochelatase
VSYYPLFLRLDGVKILLAGAGGVGRRKAASLLACRPAELLWLDPALSLPELERCPEFDRPEFAGGLAACPGLVYEQRQVLPEDVQGWHLVFAATGVRRVNDMLAGLCAERNILCNVVDAPTDGTFVVPAHFSHGDILLALCTGGQSPALASRLRRDLEAWFGKKYDPLLAVMGRLRPLLLSAPTCPPEQDKQTANATLIFRALVNSRLADSLADRDLAAARQVLLDILPAQLHDCIGDILHEPF